MIWGSSYSESSVWRRPKAGKKVLSGSWSIDTTPWPGTQQREKRRQKGEKKKAKEEAQSSFVFAEQGPKSGYRESQKHVIPKSRPKFIAKAKLKAKVSRPYFNYLKNINQVLCLLNKGPKVDTGSVNKSSRFTFQSFEEYLLTLLVSVSIIGVKFGLDFIMLTTLYVSRLQNVKSQWA